MFMMGGYAGFLAFQAHGLVFVLAIAAVRLFVMVARRHHRTGHHPSLLRPAARGPDPGHLRPVDRLRASASASLRQPVAARCRRRPGRPGVTPLGFMLYPTYRLVVVGIVAVALLALYLVLYRTRLGMIVRAGIEDPGMVDFARHQRLPRLHDGVRHRRHGGGLRRHRQCAGRVADAGHGRDDPGPDLRGRGDRRRRLVPRCHPGRPDRRPDPQHDLDDQPRLFAYGACCSRR